VILVCSTCKESFPVEDFYKSKTHTRGYSYDCKRCHIQNVSLNRKVKIRQYTEKDRANNLKRYGITIEEYESLLASQFWACAICGRDEEEFEGRLHIDHDHITGKVRGLLCRKCNSILGYADDDIDVIRKAIAYLERSSNG